jgi:two-component system response regulator MprA
MANTVLVVDDDPVLVEVIEQLLVDEGFDVRHALDGHEALSQIAEGKPDVVVTDIMMPKLNGVELARRLRERGNTIPVILMSAVYDQVDLPGVRFIPKPFDIDYFVGLIQGTVNGPAAGSAQA